MADRTRDPAAVTDGRAARLARSEYVRFERELRHGGFDAELVRAIAGEFSEQRGESWFVKQQAYLPTGVALGCPLDAAPTRRLRQIVNFLGRCIAGDTGGEAAFALVPPAAYHITVANRAHYEHSAPAVLAPDEYEIVRGCVVGAGAIEVVVCGLMLTANGKLLLTCVPIDDRLLELRRRLVEALPALAVNLPKAAHMKLAHLRVPLSDATVAPLQVLLKQIDPHVLQTIVFRDVFTPQGRIPLEEAS